METGFARAQRLIEAGRVTEAATALEQLLAGDPGVAEGWMMQALVQQRLQFHARMLASMRAAQRLRPRDLQVRLKLAEALLCNGEGGEARVLLRELEAEAAGDARLLVHVAALYTQAEAHADRLRCMRRAHAADSANPALAAGLAAAETACGGISTAEALLDELLERHPHEHGAWYRRSVLRRQEAGRNHVAQIRAELATLPARHPGQVPLCHALAKELEDLGEHAESFRYLAQGARLRREHMSYDAAADAATLAAIARQPVAGRAPTHDGPCPGSCRPVFVIGLPRSGTTLVDRILGSHTEVASLGEISDFALGLTAQLRAGDPPDSLPPAGIRLVERAGLIDTELLGADYLRRTAGYGTRRDWLIDKTPWNFLYVGLIAAALPQARIVHVSRAPMDACYALYKTLFRDGAPYSYSFADLAVYYTAYARLMQHWRSILPGRIFELRYEDLTGAPEATTRAMLQHLGLGFEAGCLEFHRNPAPAATASAAQVRQPINRRSVGMWRHYAAELEPLAAMLAAAGIDPESA